MESSASSRPLDEAALRRSLAAGGVDAPVRYEPETGSTNAVAGAMAEAGTAEWTLVATGHQTAGRGRLGRSWASEPGTALQFSFVLRPAIAPARAGLLTLLAGAAMAAACRDASGRPVGCKWPNDLVLEDGKVGGILAEARVADAVIDHVVMGIGVNLGEPPPGVDGASGLGGADAEEVLSGFLRRFADGYRRGDPGFAPFVHYAWRSVAVTLGRRVRATTTAGRTVVGLAVDVRDDGSLLVVTDDETVEVVAFGEVEHLRT